MTKDEAQDTVERSGINLDASVVSSVLTIEKNAMPWNIIILYGKGATLSTV